MSEEVNQRNGWGHVQKCCGIPMYPAEYHFDMERPEGISDEDICDRRKHLNKFLERYGL